MGTCLTARHIFPGWCRGSVQPQQEQVRFMFASAARRVVVFVLSGFGGPALCALALAVLLMPAGASAHGPAPSPGEAGAPPRPPPPRAPEGPPPRNERP